MNQTIIDTLGFIGTAILGITMLPQVYKTFKEKKVNDISLSYLVLQWIANILFLVYGYFIESLPVVISNGIVLICSSSLIYAKYAYKDDSYYPIISNV